jgi:hypothetical protein
MSYTRAQMLHDCVVGLLSWAEFPLGYGPRLKITRRVDRVRPFWKDSEL